MLCERSVVVHGRGEGDERCMVRRRGEGDEWSVMRGGRVMSGRGGWTQLNFTN